MRKVYHFIAHYGLGKDVECSLFANSYSDAKFLAHIRHPGARIIML